MMTPKEKAEELVEQFTFRCEECNYDWNAKQCALIAVDEILSIELIKESVDNYYLRYWQEVKEEIEKLK